MKTAHGKVLRGVPVLVGDAIQGPAAVVGVAVLLHLEVEARPRLGTSHRMPLNRSVL